MCSEIGRKPISIAVRTTDGARHYTLGIIPPRPPSASTTDITDEVTERASFDKRQSCHQTPDSYIRDSRDDNENDEEDSYMMPQRGSSNHNHSTNKHSKKKTFKNDSTQSEHKEMRNVGTMPDRVQTHDFGNNIQQKSSATQTQDVQQLASNGSKSNTYYSNYRPRSCDRDIQDESSPVMPLKGTNKQDYQTLHLSTVSTPYLSSPRSQTPINITPVFLPPTGYRCTSDDQEKPYTSLNVQNIITLQPTYQRKKYKSRRLVNSIETDTSLDGMHHPQNRSVQSEPRATKEHGTITSPELDNSNRSAHRTDCYRIYDDPEPIILSQYHSKSNYKDKPLPALTGDECREREKVVPSNYNGNTKSNSYNGFENGDIPERGPSNLLTETEPYVSILPDIKTYPNDSEALRSDSLISFPPATLTQPNSLSRSNYSMTPVINQDTNDSKQNIIERNNQQPIYNARIEQLPPLKELPLYHIGIENVISHPVETEYAQAFQEIYVYDSDSDFAVDNGNIRSSTLKSGRVQQRKNELHSLNLLNSSRSYVIEKQVINDYSIRQSNTNGNFYFTTSPTIRSSNSSFQADESEISPFTTAIDAAVRDEPYV